MENEHLKINKDIERVFEEMSSKRHEIIDLFLKTFFISRSAISNQELEIIFNKYELVFSHHMEGKDFYLSYAIQERRK